MESPRLVFPARLLCFVTAGLAFTLLSGHALAQLGVSQVGEATYRKVIAVPPGVAGIEPKLALSYGSQNSVNGPVGYGWSLEGVSVITRCSATREVDGVKAGVLYKASDKLCLDGERLIPLRISDGAALVGRNTNDAAGLPAGSYTEYRTEKESYARIRAYGYADSTNADSGPQYFKVWTKSGLIFEYGDTPSKDANTKALIQASYPTGQTIKYAQLWAVARVSDAFGNHMDFKYTQSDVTWGSAGRLPQGHQWNLAEIQYSGNKVIFSYEPRGSSSPQDAAEAYNQGTKNLSLNRLKTVTTYVNSPNVTVMGPATGSSPALAVKTYRLGYDNGPRTQRSRLTTIQECAGNSSTKCLPAVTLEYSAGGDERYELNSKFNLGGLEMNDGYIYAAYSADFNGDGKSDLLVASFFGGILYFSNGDGSFTQVSQFNLSGVPLYSEAGCDYSIAIADFSGDGLPDILRYSPVNAGVCDFGRRPDDPALYINNGDGTFRSVTLSGVGLTDLNRAVVTPGTDATVSVSEARTIYVIDVDGDGKADIVKTYLQGTPFNNENGNGQGASVSDPYPQIGSTQVFLSNGDGSFRSVATNLGSIPIYSFSDRLVGLSSTFDIDGDGLEDILVSNTPSVPNYQLNTSLMVARSRGDGNFDLIRIPNCVQSIVTASCGTWSLDYNGSGRSSLLYANDTGAASNQLYVGDGPLGAVTRTTNFNLTTNADELVALRYFDTPYYDGVVIADFNSDGRDDILRWSTSQTAGVPNVLYLSDGDGLFKPSQSFNLPGSTPAQHFGGVDGLNTYGVVVGDFTGNGNTELIATTHERPNTPSSGSFAHDYLYTKVNRELPDRLMKITDENGRVTSLRYASLAHPDFDGNTLGQRYKTDRVPNAAPGVKIDVTQSQQVVVSVQEDNGVGGNFVSEYSYYGQKAHSNGRGDLGFRAVRRQSVAPNGEPITTETQYQQDFPYTGMVSNTAVYRSKLDATNAGVLLSNTVSLYCDQTRPAGTDGYLISVGLSCPSASNPSAVPPDVIKRPYLMWTKTTGYDTDASRTQLPTVTTYTTVNSTGDPTQVVSTTTSTGSASDTYKKTTVNQYRTDDTACSDSTTCNWVLGRVEQSTVQSTVPSAILSTSAGTGPNATATAGSLASQAAGITSSLAFGTVTVGQASTLVATLVNTGVAPISVTSPNGTSVVGQGFGFVSTTCATSLLPGAECAVTVRFAPTTAGAASGTLSVATSAGTKAASLSGAGAAPTVSIQPGWTNWGVIGAGSDSGDWYTVKNNSAVTVVLTASGVVSGPTGVYAYSGTSTAGYCLFGTTVLAPGASCISFFGTGALAAPGAYSATFSVSYQAQGVGTVFNTQQSYNFSVATATSSPTALALGLVEAGITSPTKTFTVTNGASESFDNIVVSKGGATPDRFNVTHNCGTTIPANGSCTVTVSFSPTTPATDYSTLIAVSGQYARLQGGGKTTYYPTAQNLVGVSVTGTGWGSISTLTSPSTVTLPAVWYGASSQSFTVTYRNDGNASMRLVSPSLQFPFTVSSNTCASVAPGASCSMVITEVTNVVGLNQSQTVTPSGATSGPAATTATWTIYSAVPMWSTTSLSFGGVTAGTSSSQVITLSNGGNAAYNWAANSSIVNAPAGYSFNTSACANVTPGGNCPVTVTFTPTAIGTTYSGSGLTMAAASYTANTFSVSGTGAGSIAAVQANAAFGSYGYGASIPNQSVTVKNNGNAPMSLSVTGYASPFSLASNGCSNVAAGASCSIAFALANNVIGSASQTVTLSGATGGAVTATLSGMVSGSIASVQQSAAWGSVSYGASLGTMAVILKNTGNTAMTAYPTGYSSPFSLVSNNCSNVAVGGTCVISFAMSSNVAPATYNQSLGITGASQTSGVATLSGTILSVVPNFATTSLAFGSVAVNTTKTLTVSVRNDGAGAAKWTTLGGLPAGFTANTSACANVAPGVSCNLSVTFAPTAVSSYGGSGITLTPYSSSANWLSVSGTGAGTVSKFTLTLVSGDPTQARWTLTNNGTASAVLSALGTTDTGGNARVISTTCAVGSSVAVGASCTVVTANGESCGGSYAYYLTATNSAGTAQSNTYWWVGNASCGAALETPRHEAAARPRIRPRERDALLGYLVGKGEAASLRVSHG